jgi:hypothetical protein
MSNVQTKVHAIPPMKTGGPPYMSTKRPNVKSRADTTKDVTPADHVADVLDIARSSINVGTMAKKLLVRYSSMNWDIDIEKT